MNVLPRARRILALAVSLACLASCGPGAPSSSPTLAPPADAPALGSRSTPATIAVPAAAVATALDQAPDPAAVAREPAAAQTPTIEPTPASRDTRLLAGLEAKAQWLDATEAARVKRHAARADADFAYFGRKVGEPMARWAEQTLPHEDGETIFYPFAGPDFVTAHRLYPRAGRYVLVAMQKAGPPPPLSQLEVDDRRTTFELHGQIMRNFTRLGFFVTKQMNERFHRELPTAGLTGTLMAFAEREGYAVLDVEPITVDAQGEVVTHPGAREQTQTWSSVRLHLRRRADGRTVTLDYLRVNLADWSLRKRESERRFVQLMSGHRTLLKAASHLLQERYGFSEIRDALLDNAPSILQDETGLPYDRLVEGHQVRLFGDYEAPHELFDADPQEPLAQAYASGGDSVKPLPFRIGYRKQAGSCLQYAERDASES